MSSYASRISIPSAQPTAGEVSSNQQAQEAAGRARQGVLALL